jgi:hypothetical protein
MTLEQLMAFTVTSDRTRRQQVWEALQHSGNTSPYHIRHKLTEDTVPAFDKRARFVGIDTNEQAGDGVEVAAALAPGQAIRIPGAAPAASICARGGSVLPNVTSVLSSDNNKHGASERSHWVAPHPAIGKVASIRYDTNGWWAFPHHLECYNYGTPTWRTLDSAKAQCIAFVYEPLARGKA